jgi:hypothetical protein
MYWTGWVDILWWGFLMTVEFLGFISVLNYPSRHTVLSSQRSFLVGCALVNCFCPPLVHFGFRNDCISCMPQNCLSLQHTWWTWIKNLHLAVYQFMRMKECVWCPSCPPPPPISCEFFFFFTLICTITVNATKETFKLPLWITANVWDKWHTLKLAFCQVWVYEYWFEWCKGNRISHLYLFESVEAVAYIPCILHQIVIVTAEFL